MRYLLIALALLIAGCTIQTYQPKLAVEPKNPEKYESDRQACIAEVQKRSKLAVEEYQSSGRWLMPGLFGAAGAVVDNGTSDKDYNKSGYTMMDECMTAKGYKIIH